MGDNKLRFSKMLKRTHKRMTTFIVVYRFNLRKHMHSLELTIDNRKK